MNDTKYYQANAFNLVEYPVPLCGDHSNLASQFAAPHANVRMYAKMTQDFFDACLVLIRH
jgi:hypothetical protein